MLFNSIEFLFFFPIVLLIYFLLPHKFRWIHLLIASCYFYMAFVPIYILILVFTIVVDYVAGILIENAEGRKRKLYLILSIVANIGVLSVFKYYNFINENLSFIVNSIGFTNPIPFLTIALPIGLSFHTFQAMSYTIEVYRGNQKAERHFGIYSLYVLFFPQLVAGPIERPQHMLYQFYEKHVFDYRNAVEGLQRMLWGLFQKVVIADNLSIYVNEVYDHPEKYHGTPVVLAVIFFAIQVYCDFSGYSNIAIGSAKVMGYNLTENFNFPYISKSVTEFWRRWHISLSSWFNDYVFTPFIINKRTWGIVGIATGLLITFVAIGLWHGPELKYMVFGALQGIAIIYEMLTKKVRKKIFSFFNQGISDILSNIITFSFCAFTMIFFRAKTIQSALLTARNFFEIDFSKIGINIYLPNAHKGYFAVCFLSIATLFVMHYMWRKGNMYELTRKKAIAFRWSVYLLLIFCIVFFGNYSRTKDFIYFQF